MRVRNLERIPKGMLQILLDCLEYPSHGGNLNAQVQLLSGRRYKVLSQLPLATWV